jgi:putative transposase
LSFEYESSPGLPALLEEFRHMCNDAVGIAIRQRPKNRLKLIELAYPRLKEYRLQTHYILSACQVAYSIYRNKDRKSIPYISKPFLKLDNQTYRINHLLLRTPTSPKNYIFLELRGSNHHISMVDDPRLKKGSVVINEQKVCIPVSKRIEAFEQAGSIGVDINERNVAVSATDGWCQQFTTLGEVAEIKERYRVIRAKISKMSRGDNRIAKELLAKYGRRERNRTESRLHNMTKEIVNYAKNHELGIKMERLTGIRRLYRKGNRQSASFRERMNSWVFGETQRQIEYKAKWDGVPNYFVNPRGTSRNCPDCGSRVAPLQDRRLYCPKCDKTWERDDLASKNIMACAVPQARPLKRSNDWEGGGDCSNPQSRWGEATPAAVSAPG